MAYRRPPHYQRARAKAQEVLTVLNYKTPPVNPLTVAKKYGIEVAFVSFPQSPRVSGFYDPTEQKIYVNSEEKTQQQAFTIAHELGHALLHQEWAKSNNYRVLMRDKDAEDNDPKEKEANVFAAHLLVPGEMLIRFADSINLKELSHIFVVSEKMLGYRIAHEF